MFALVDCNNFFVSCERAFQPELEGRAVVVLSNNDGCVVARSNESKALGIKMGTPFFKLKYLVDEGRLAVRSSNYTLYGDLSERVMSILRSEAPAIEIYSIDEAFMILDGISDEAIVPFCRRLVRKIRKWVGIPVSIGVAPTKTLAKAASHFAKKYPGYKGVCVIDSEEKRLKALSLTEISDVWGIGRRSAPKLEAKGVRTAGDFALRNREWVRREMGVTGVRTWMELNGTPAVQEHNDESRQTICTSRSFAEMTDDYEEISLKVSDFAAMCAKKLRDDGTVARTVGVFLLTNRFREDLAQYYPQAAVTLEVPANSTQEIVKAALRALRSIYRKGFSYKKAGVVVADTIPETEVIPTLFDNRAESREKDDTISRIMDRVNTGNRNIVRLAVQRGGHYSDGIRSEFRSGRYSTSWDELLLIH